MIVEGSFGSPSAFLGHRCVLAPRNLGRSLDRRQRQQRVQTELQKDYIGVSNRTTEKGPGKPSVEGKRIADCSFDHRSLRELANTVIGCMPSSNRLPENRVKTTESV